MGVTIAVTRVACPTGTGTQDITTTDLGGLTPKAALFIVNKATADGSAADHAVLAIGACTGAANRWSSGGFQEHGQDTTDAGDASSDDYCIFISNMAGGADALADFSAWITNGVRINWSDAPGAAYLLTVVLFAGSDLSAKAGVISLGDTLNNAVDVTGVGFEPDVVIASVLASADGEAANWKTAGNLGFVHNGDSVTQRCLLKFWRDNQGTSDEALQVRTDGGTGQCFQGSSGLDWYGEFGTFDADGFTVTTRNAGANNSRLVYLALAFAGAQHAWVGTHTTPTSTGNNSESGPGFQPQAVLLIQNLAEAAATAYSDSRAGSFGLSVITATAQYATSVSSEDGAGTSNTQSLSDDQSVQLPDDDGVALLAVTHVSLDASGWTTNYTAVAAAAKLFLGLAIGAAAGGANLPEFMRSYRQWRVA